MPNVYSVAAKLLNRLWQPNETKELWVRVPLGWTKRRQYFLERDAMAVGWMYRYLLVCADWRTARPGWRVQSQVKYAPLTDWDYARADAERN